VNDGASDRGGQDIFPVCFFSGTMICGIEEVPEVYYNGKFTRELLEVDIPKGNQGVTLHELQQSLGFCNPNCTGT